MRFEVTTHATPDQVREALTDFTDRRTRIWNRTLDPLAYEVRAVGDTWAVAREQARQVAARDRQVAVQREPRMLDPIRHPDARSRPG